MLARACSRLLRPSSILLSHGVMALISASVNDKVLLLIHLFGMIIKRTCKAAKRIMMGHHHNASLISYVEGGHAGITMLFPNEAGNRDLS